MWGRKIWLRRVRRMSCLQIRATCAEAERDAACAERDAARAEAAEQHAAAVRTAGRHEHLVTQLAVALCGRDGYRARIDRLVRACARYRADLARAEREVARLQARRLDMPRPAAKETTP